jgi:formylmethanofuran dehydrogenase subunit E-like metal-binding protein
MHVTTLVISDMESQGLSLANSPGDTAVEDLRERHSEIVNLTLNQLTKFAKLMATNIYTNEHCFLFTRKDVARIIKTAMSQQRLDGQKLNPKLLSQLSNISI